MSTAARLRHVLLLLGAALLVSCAGNGSGRLAVHSQKSPGTVLRSGFTTASYRFDDHDHLTVLLVNGAVDNPREVVTIRLFWTPRAGRTPIDPTATNATIHYVIFSGDKQEEVGVYSGAGFVFPADKPGKDSVELQVWQANLRLTDRSGNFADLLGQSLLRGRLSAIRDDAATQSDLRKLNVLIRQKLGYPRLVGPAQLAPAAAAVPSAQPSDS